MHGPVVTGHLSGCSDGLRWDPIRSEAPLPVPERPERAWTSDRSCTSLMTGPTCLFCPVRSIPPHGWTFLLDSLQSHQPQPEPKSHLTSRHLHLPSPEGQLDVEIGNLGCLGEHPNAVVLCIRAAATQHLSGASTTSIYSPQFWGLKPEIRVRRSGAG